MIFKKLITLFGESKTKEIDAVELWFVKWYARYGEFSSNVTQVVEGFTTEEQAMEFKRTLETAQKVLKYSEDIGIRCYKDSK